MIPSTPCHHSQGPLARATAASRPKDGCAPIPVGYGPWPKMASKLIIENHQSFSWATSQGLKSFQSSYDLHGGIAGECPRAYAVRQDTQLIERISSPCFELPLTNTLMQRVEKLMTVLVVVSVAYYLRSYDLVPLSRKESDGGCRDSRGNPPAPESHHLASSTSD